MLVVMYSDWQIDDVVFGMPQLANLESYDPNFSSGTIGLDITIPVCSDKPSLFLETTGIAFPNEPSLCQTSQTDEFFPNDYIVCLRKTVEEYHRLKDENSTLKNKNHALITKMKVMQDLFARQIACISYARVGNNITMSKRDVKPEQAVSPKPIQIPIQSPEQNPIIIQTPPIVSSKRNRVKKSKRAGLSIPKSNDYKPTMKIGPIVPRPKRERKKEPSSFPKHSAVKRVPYIRPSNRSGIPRIPVCAEDIDNIPTDKLKGAFCMFRSRIYRIGKKIETNGTSEKNDLDDIAYNNMLMLLVKERMDKLGIPLYCKKKLVEEQSS